MSNITSPTELEEALAGGRKNWKWHYSRDDNGDPAAERFFMDAEFDPVRATFDTREGG